MYPPGLWLSLILTRDLVFESQVFWFHILAKNYLCLLNFEREQARKFKNIRRMAAAKTV